MQKNDKFFKVNLVDFESSGLAKLNLTGRRFMCVNNNFELIENNGIFQEGKIYYEAIFDSKGNKNKWDFVLLLISKDACDSGWSFYVKPNNFILLEDKVENIILDFVFSLN